MSDTAQKSVLARKADLVRMQGRRKVERIDYGKMPEKALNRAVKRAGMPLGALEIEPRDETMAWDQTLAEVTEMLSDGGLLVVLEGEDRARGLLHLHQGLLDGLIEVQTTGHVDTIDGPPRASTQIDAALSRDFIDLLLSALATELEDAGIPNIVVRMHFGTVLDERRQLPLLVPERGFHVFRCKTDLAQGAKVGALVLAMPGTQTAASWPKRGPDPQFRAAFHRTLSQARLRLETVLFRREIALKDALSLQPGSIIPFDAEMLGAVRVEDRMKRAILKGRLGQAGGNRALRLTIGAIEEPEAEDTPPNFAQPTIQNTPQAEGAPPTDTSLVEPGVPPLDAGGLPPLGGDGLPPLGGEEGQPPLGEGGLPPLGEGGLPPLGEGELPPLDEGGLPPLGEGGLPPLGDGGLPPLGEGGLPPLGTDGLPDLPEPGS